MTESSDYLTIISSLPLNTLLIVVVIYLWRRILAQNKEIKNLYDKIADLSKELGYLKGKVEVEERIDKKLDLLISNIKK